MTLDTILQKHGLTQREVAAGTGLALSAVNDIVNEKRCPTTATVNRILDFLRRYEPGVTYEELFGDGKVA